MSNEIKYPSYFLAKSSRPGNFTPSLIYSMKILTTLINQQINIRAYEISKNKFFLESYYLGNKEVQEYSDSINNIKNINLNIETINQLNEQINSIQVFFEKQIALVQNGKSYEAGLALIQGKNMIDEFTVTDNILINKIDLEVNKSLEKVSNIQLIHKQLMLFLGIIFVLGNFIFIKYIWIGMYKEIKKK